MTSKEYIENIKYLADMINHELGIMIEHTELIKANHLNKDYYEGIARGFKDARNIVNDTINKALFMQLDARELKEARYMLNNIIDKALSMQEVVKGEEQE